MYFTCSGKFLEVTKVFVHPGTIPDKEEDYLLPNGSTADQFGLRLPVAEGDLVRDA